MSELKQQDIVDCINIDFSRLRDIFVKSVELFDRNPRFCIPEDAWQIYQQHDAETEVILLGTTPFSKVVIREAKGYLKIIAVVDDSRADSGEQFMSLPIITSAQMLAMVKNRKTITINGCRYDHARRYFKNLTQQHAIPSINFEQSLRLLDIRQAKDHRIGDWGHAIAKSAAEYIALADRLADNHSRFTLFSVLQFQLTCNPEWVLHAAHPYCTLYFRSGVWSPTRHERFADCGASIGESTRALIDVTQGQFDKIWMIEPDRYNVETLEKLVQSYVGSPLHPKLKLHGCAVSDQSHQLPFVHQGGHGGRLIDSNAATDFVDVRPLDKLLDEMPTLIKMDVEGAELAALRGAKRILQQGKPKLAISAYHRESDLLDISAFVMETNPGYRIGIRHHTEERWDTCLYFY